MIKQITGIFVVILLLVGCSSKEEQIQQAIAQESVATEKALKNLEEALNNGKVRNVAILNQYAEEIKKRRPELSVLVDQLARDGTTSGPMYDNLYQRWLDASKAPELFVNPDERIQELQLVREASSVNLFSDALSDPINVLADLSVGDLPRINAISRAAEKEANKSFDFGYGSQLVGNPNYGQWTTNSNGMSFWEWYGMYALISNILHPYPINYNRWAPYRSYSYYSDYGRSRYTSRKDYKRQESMISKTKKSFAAKGQAFSSPYASRKSGATSLSRASKTPSRVSSYSSKSSYGRKSSASLRSSSSRTSRGVRGGK